VTAEAVKVLHAVGETFGRAAPAARARIASLRAPQRARAVKNADTAMKIAVIPGDGKRLRLRRASGASRAAGEWGWGPAST
jgi:hypothetical protein